MKCTCGSSTNVVDARYVPEGYWRKRKCPSCGTIITTVEQQCETIKGNKGNQPKVKVPPPPKVKAPGARAKRRELPPAEPKNGKPVWSRVQALKEERELASIDNLS